MLRVLNLRSCLIALLLLAHALGCSSRAEYDSKPTAEAAQSASVRFAVKQPPDGSLSQVPHATGIAGSSFQRLDPAETGVDFTCHLDTEHPLRRIYYSGYVCGGVAIGDIDNDGLVDLFLVSGGQSNRLYRQVESLKFEDMTAQAGVGGGEAWGTGAALIDIDNDLDLDIYVCNYDAPNQLFVNQGDGRFVELATQWGLDLVDACLFPAFGDIDRDGDLDLYLLTNRYQREGGRPSVKPFEMVNGKPVVLPEYEKYYALTEVGSGRFGIDNYGREDYLLVNDGQGRFHDRTAESGIYGHGDGLSATWLDYDADGWPDLYVCNDFDEPDRLYRNDGDGTFTNELLGSVPHTTWSSMGSDAADINNDGLVDLFVLDMSGTNHFKQKTTMGSMNAARIEAVAGPPPQYMRNAMLLNAGDGRFMEIAYMAGIADSDWSWAAKLADFDNDGLVDAFVSNGVIRNFNDSDVEFSKSMLVGRTEWDIYQHTGPRREQNLAFRNDGDLAFSDASRTWGLDHIGMSYGAAWGDLDNDGDLDLIVANVDEPISIFRNDISSGHRATFRLVGKESNRFGLGASVEIETASGKQVRQLSPLTGFLSCNQAIAHFGLGDEKRIERVTVRWPSGHEQVIEDLVADHHFILHESNSSESNPTAHLAATPMFVPAENFPRIFHGEDKFDDFAKQPLLPNRMSQFGPGMAWGDVDADGDDDLFVGGGAGHAASLWINQGKGHFQQLDIPAIAAHAGHEDLGSLLFDSDGDGDLDLYVVSGGTNTRTCRDRLYINQGQGKLSYDEQALPEQRVSGSVVVANDFDRDGDLDLFVGGRMIPGEYPLAPKSQLLRNDDGKFVDVADLVASALVSSGMVTGAVWSDANGDGWSDLLVTYEWGPVRLFVNEQGRLVDATKRMGLEAHTGWWNGITSGDLDNDGDMDFVATNFGLNTKYHASQEKPALLYYGDFERSGRMRLIEAEYEDQHLFPIRGKSCSTHAMPFLRQKFTSYKDFALADLSQIYTNECLSDAHRFATTTLESCVLLNQGDRFDVVPLPRLAQNAPAFGVTLIDVDADDHLDLYLVQNFYGPQPETGHMDGGLSLLMRGRGDGHFTPVWPNKSGLIVPDDAKSLAVIDLNSDAWPDFVTACNQGPVRAFIRDIPKSIQQRGMEVRLKGSPANRQGIGAKVVLHLDDGTRRTREIQAGSGYLSQSTAAAFFALAENSVPARIEVEWPDGQTSQIDVVSGQRRYVIAKD